MRTPRFLLSPEQLLGSVVVLAGADRRHARVLRLAAGAAVRLCDGAGREYSGRVRSVVEDRLEVERGEELRRDPEPPVAVTLYQGLARGEKLELTLQKATELGVARFVPLACARSEVRLGHVSLARLLRWREIARQAARQSERTRVPEVCPPCDLEQALASARQADVAVLPYEGSRPSDGWRARLSGRSGIRSAALLVGPEGGFTAEEVAAAEAAGVIPVSLGPRILRTETAGLVAVTLALFCWGDLGGT
jgi:16S rRNA (uracil1498-N3)-methyltransferase